MSYGEKDGKTFRLQFDVSGATTTDVYAILDAVPSDDEDYLEGVMNDSDTEFVPVSSDAEAAATEDNFEDEITDGNTAGPYIRQAVHLDAVVHSYVAEEPVVLEEQEQCDQTEVEVVLQEQEQTEVPQSDEATGKRKLRARINFLLNLA